MRAIINDEMNEDTLLLSETSIHEKYYAKVFYRAKLNMTWIKISFSEPI